MPAVPMGEILSDAFRLRYGVGAFNVVNDFTMQAVLAAAVEMRSPVIVQVSVKTVRQLGARLLQQMFQDFARRAPIPAALHLDHCPDRVMIEECVAAGWSSVLFDASNLSYAENLVQTTEVVAFAHAHGVAVEGELEAVEGVEDDIGSADEGIVVSLEQAVEFMRSTRIDSFAPAIGTAHGVYRREPKINFTRVEQIVAAEPRPLVLHGGTGLKDEVIRELIRLGAVKVNISTQLKITYIDAIRAHLDQYPVQHDPAQLHASVQLRVQKMAAGYMRVFGSEGRAG